MKCLYHLLTLGPMLQCFISTIKQKLECAIEQIFVLELRISFVTSYFPQKIFIVLINDLGIDRLFFTAAMGGLLGLGLGMSFISAIEILYFIFFRRPFVWYRTNLTIRRNQNPENQPIPENTIPPNHQVKFKKNKSLSSSSKAQSATTMTIHQIVDPTLDLRYSNIHPSTSDDLGSVELHTQPMNTKQRKN